MYYSEKLLETLTKAELCATLQSIFDNDYYVKDFKDSNMLRQFLYMLVTYDLAYVSVHEHRVLLTSVGEKMLQILNQKLI